MATIRNPIQWSWDQLKLTARAVGSAGDALGRIEKETHVPLPTVRRIVFSDLRQALARGLEDFGACRTDVIFLCLIYPVTGLVLGRLMFGYGMVPLLFPLASGFALIGPFATVGLMEMSRRREKGIHVGWPDAMSVVRTPSFGAILTLGLFLVLLLLLWLVAADSLYNATLGPKPPASIAGFVSDVFTTPAGWALIASGTAIGFLFAVVSLTVSVVSFPMLLDRNVGLGLAVRTSVRAVGRNPVAMAAWGLIVAGGLVIGALPLLLGLIVVLPVLGHATWHLYRRLIAG